MLFLENLTEGKQMSRNFSDPLFFKKFFQKLFFGWIGIIFSLPFSNAGNASTSVPSAPSTALHQRPLLDTPSNGLSANDATQPIVQKKPITSIQPKSLVKLEKYCKKHPKKWEAKYNLGIEKYQLMDYVGAKQSFSEAIQVCQNPEQQENTFYNLGNACFRHALSSPEDQQIPILEESLQHYENALALKKSEDTEHNIAVVKKHLKNRQKQQQKKQQQKQPQQNQQKNNQNQKNDPQKDSQNPPPSPENKTPPPASSEEEKVDLKQQEMDNILNREKRIEKMLPPSSNQTGNDSVIKDW